MKHFSEHRKRSIGRVLKKIDRTSESKLRAKLFGKNKYIDTPGSYDDEKVDYSYDVFLYMENNMGSKEFDKLIKWIQLHQTDIKSFMKS